MAVFLLLPGLTEYPGRSGHDFKSRSGSVHLIGTLYISSNENEKYSVPSQRGMLLKLMRIEFLGEEPVDL